jgi:C-terminal processing protease CtpA/Prc
MNREKLAWSVSAVMLAVLAFQMPSSLSQRDDDMTFVRTLADIHRRVDDNYVDPVDEARLDRGAIDGMLAQLDPYSVYVPPEREADFDRMLTGNFKGVGIQLAPRPDGTFEVVTPLDGSPAAASGIEPGDVLLAVDGKPLAHVQMPDVIRMVGGAAVEGRSATSTARRPPTRWSATRSTRPPSGATAGVRTTVGTSPFARAPSSATPGSRSSPATATTSCGRRSTACWPRGRGG